MPNTCQNVGTLEVFLKVYYCDANARYNMRIKRTNFTTFIIFKQRSHPHRNHTVSIFKVIVELALSYQSRISDAQTPTKSYIIPKQN